MVQGGNHRSPLERLAAMKQLLQNYKTGELELEAVPVPALKPGGVLVKNHYSLVSAGTERTVIEFAKQSLASKARSRPDLAKQILSKIKTNGLVSTYHAAMQRLDEPLPLGYSCAGEVIEVGQGAEEFSKGDLVACGGAGYASHAEVVFVPKNLAVKIPDNVSTKGGSVCHPSATLPRRGYHSGHLLVVQDIG